MEKGQTIVWLNRIGIIIFFLHSDVHFIGICQLLAELSLRNAHIENSVLTAMQNGDPEKLDDACNEWKQRLNLLYVPNQQPDYDTPSACGYPTSQLMEIKKLQSCYVL